MPGGVRDSRHRSVECFRWCLPAEGLSSAAVQLCSDLSPVGFGNAQNASTSSRASARKSIVPSESLAHGLSRSPGSDAGGLRLVSARLESARHRSAVRRRTLRLGLGRPEHLEDRGRWVDRGTASVLRIVRDATHVCVVSVDYSGQCGPRLRGVGMAGNGRYILAGHRLSGTRRCRRHPSACSTTSAAMRVIGNRTTLGSKVATLRNAVN